jgi:acyl-CoA synthetase (AMP-forming)/AMP-acid ligase II
VNIITILQDWAQQQPNAPAIIDARDRQPLSFAELEQASGQAAALLQQSGLQAGDAVLIFLPMSAQLYVALLAIFRLGLMAMFVDPSAGPQHLDRCCALHPPKALIATSKAHLLRLRSTALRQIPHQYAIGLPVPGAIPWRRASALPQCEFVADCDSHTPALLTFTSGSTGQPKAALRSHGFLLAQHRALAESLKLAPGQIDLTTLPIFALANLASGVTSLIPDADLRFPGNINAAAVIQQIHAYQPHSTAASPAFLMRLTASAERQRLTLPSFQRIFSGGAPVFPTLLDRLQRLAPQAEISAVYGSTEAEPIAHIARDRMQPQDLAAMVQGQGLLVGVPVPQIQLRISPDRWGQPIPALTADQFAALSLPAGQTGEIVVSGEHVLPEYLHGQGNAETKFRVAEQPWHRTGDAGYLDTQGRLWLMGRCSARIEDEHGTLYPFAVEVAAQQFDGIRRSAIVPHQGQRVLVLELEAGRQSVPVDSLKRELAWAQIQQFVRCPEIPVDKRHNAKVDYPALRQFLQRISD